MRVIAINGSPNKEGNTYHALKIIGSRLNENGIDLEIIHIGNKAIRGCIACGKSCDQFYQIKQFTDERLTCTVKPVRCMNMPTPVSDYLLQEDVIYQIPE